MEKKENARLRCYLDDKQILCHREFPIPPHGGDLVQLSYCEIAEVIDTCHLPVNRVELLLQQKFLFVRGIIFSPSEIIIELSITN